MMIRPTDLSVAELVRAACLEAALEAYEDAGLMGLCAEGRWEAAIDAIRRIDPELLHEQRREAGGD